MQAGIWNFDGEPITPEALTRLSRPLVDYGPDGEAFHCKGSIGMVHRPFHTSAESMSQHQPHMSAGGNVITWDGRLDTREELMSQLSGVLGADQTEPAIVAAAFDQWGTDCLSRFVGDWAISIWHSNDRELILARDYMGIRHLFYSLKFNRVTWCNHLAPLALGGEKLTVCDRYVAGYLAADPEAHLTPYQEISAVPPGNFVRIRNASATIHRFWHYDARHRVRCNTDADYEDAYRQLFRQSVRRRLRTNSAVLADLSGGLDSTSIVCMADEILTQEPGTAPRLDTFSFFDLQEPDDDDLQHLTAVEKKRGRIGFHANLQGSGNSFAFDYESFVASPTFGGRAEINAALSTIPGGHEYRVALSGRGGDEFNGQALDPRVQIADLMRRFRFVEAARQLTAWSLLIRKRPWVHLLLQSMLQFAPVSVRARLNEQGKVEPWVNPLFASKYKMSSLQIDAAEGLLFASPRIRDALHTVITVGRQMSCLEPRVMESRYPYLDQDLVEFLTAVPLDQLLRPGQRRSLMRRALANILPPEVLARKTKSLVSRCFSLTLEKHWQEVEDIFRCPLSSSLGYLDREQMARALLSTKRGQNSPYLLRQLRALSLEIWLRQAQAHSVISIPFSSSQVRGGSLAEG